MTKLKARIILIVLLCSAGKAFTQESYELRFFEKYDLRWLISFDHKTSFPPLENISFIGQDSTGFIYFGGHRESGNYFSLYRFDGANLIYFESSWSNNKLFGLNQRDMTFVNYEGSIATYSDFKGKFPFDQNVSSSSVRFVNSIKDSICQILVTPSESIILTTSNKLYQVGENRKTIDSLIFQQDERPLLLEINRAGSVILVTTKSIYSILKNSIVKSIDLTDFRVIDARISGEDICLITWNGIKLLNFRSSSDIEDIPYDFTKYVISSQFNHENMHLVSGGKLLRFNIRKKVFFEVATNLNNDSFDKITAIYSDYLSNIWIALMGGEVYKASELPNTFSPVTSVVKQRIKNDIDWKLINFSYGSDVSSSTILNDSISFIVFRYGENPYFRSPLHLGWLNDTLYLKSETTVYSCNIKIDRYTPRSVHLTSFDYGNKIKFALDNIDINGNRIQDIFPGQYSENSNSIKNLTLKYNQNNITLSFRLFHYSREFQDFGVELTINGNIEETPLYGNIVTLFRLPPGLYDLEIQSRSLEADSKKLTILILAPWYWSKIALAIYTIIGISLLIYLYYFLLSRRLLQQQYEKAQEIDSFKTSLYTNITHEFRTPLTVISGMAERVAEDPDNWLNKGTQLIKRNSQILLNLVNQMLELRTIESGSAKVNSIQGDIVGYIKYLLESFHSMAESKDIQLHFHCEEDQIVMDYDPEKINYIISNLISNAIKFTPNKGSIYTNLSVSTEDNGSYLTIKIRDTGKGIPEDQQDKIFDRFYQVDDSASREGEGTGIGLALTKELVNLLKGQIKVKSKVGTGSTFTVSLPITQDAPKSDIRQLRFINAIRSETVQEAQSEDDGRSTILIVEDNQDVITYISSCLNQSYNVTLAMNGAQGIEKALEMVPDLIITDVMMPEKDGFEVCGILKSDDRTSHIPIIMLTAKADHQSKLEGLRRGADAYLPKPFDQEELLIRIAKLLELRKELQIKYVQLLDNKIEEVSPEDEFVLKAKQIVEANLANEHFKGAYLERALGIGRTQLYNKLKALTGYSSTEFINSVRLNKAKELLETGKGNVSEVAFEVGYNSISYFSKLFKEKFGYSPSEHLSN